MRTAKDYMSEYLPDYEYMVNGERFPCYNMNKVGRMIDDAKADAVEEFKRLFLREQKGNKQK